MLFLITVVIIIKIMLYSLLSILLIDDVLCKYIYYILLISVVAMLY